MLGAEAGATEKETGQKETARVERNNGDGGAVAGSALFGAPPTRPFAAPRRPGT